jgi:hypothetical protein
MEAIEEIHQSLLSGKDGLWVIFAFDSILFNFIRRVIMKNLSSGVRCNACLS